MAREPSSSEGCAGSIFTASTESLVSGTWISASSSLASDSRISASPATSVSGKELRTEGVRRSASTRHVRVSRSRPNESARFTAVVVLPSPGRAEVMTRLRIGRIRRSDCSRARSVRYSSPTRMGDGPATTRERRAERSFSRRCDSRRFSARVGFAALAAFLRAFFSVRVSFSGRSALARRARRRRRRLLTGSAASSSSSSSSISGSGAGSNEGGRSSSSGATWGRGGAPASLARCSSAL